MARILTNQVGYEPLGAKMAVIQGHAGDEFTAFTVMGYPCGETAFSGKLTHDSPVRKWKDCDFWMVDWSTVDKEGAYIIEFAGAAVAVVRSPPILVQKDALERAKGPMRTDSEKGRASS